MSRLRKIDYRLAIIKKLGVVLNVQSDEAKG